MLDSFAYRKKVYHETLSRLVPQLNAVHVTDRDVRYWEIIIGPWLMYFINYLHYRHNFIKTSPALTCDKDEAFIVPYDYLSLFYIFENFNYAGQLDSLLSGGLKKDAVTGWKAVSFRPSHWNDRKMKLIQVISFLSKYFLIGSKVIITSPSIPMWGQLKMWLSSFFRIVPVYFFSPPQATPINSEMRSWKTTPPSDHFPTDDFRSALEEIILGQIPVAYIEGYKGLKQKADCISKKTRVVLSSFGWTQNEMLKVYGAELSQRGGKLIGLQHGGGPYGTALSLTVDQEISNVDMFLTWGWKGPENTLPFYCVRFNTLFGKFRSLKKMNEKRKLPKYILYATTSSSLFTPDCLGGLPGRDFHIYKDWQKRFLTALVPSIFPELLVRLNSLEELMGNNQRRDMEKLGLNISFDTRASFLDSASRAKLVIADNNYTLHLESMVYDIPTIFFFDSKLIPLQPQAQGLFEEMEKVGIYHSSPESAARKINAIQADPEAWWNSQEVKKAWKSYLQLFARIDPLILGKLKKLLLEQANLPTRQVGESLLTE